MTKKKNTKPVEKKVKPKGKDFFRADVNDDVYIKRKIAKEGGISGIKLG